MNIKTEKGQHYTSAQGYRDEDGNHKNFTMINHDVKPSIAVGIEDYDKDWLVKNRKETLDEIFAISASLCPEAYQDFTLRGESYSAIEWNKQMLSDEGIDIVRLWFLRNILRNRVELVGKTY